MIEMIAGRKVPQGDDFQHDAEHQCRAEREHHADQKIPGQATKVAAK